jgi:hypothetical protein
MAGAIIDPLGITAQQRVVPFEICIAAIRFSELEPL